MSIVPDVKDWTWVLERACPDCGFDAAATAYDEVPELALSSARRLGATLERPEAAVRPDASTWSPLEYGAHVRDVCRIFVYRVAVVTGAEAVDPGVPAFDPRGRAAGETPDGLPEFSNWDQDATAVADRYGAQDPAVVAAELSVAADATARAFAAVSPADRGLRARRSNGSLFTVESLAKYFAHDLVHHVHDVRG